MRWKLAGVVDRWLERRQERRERKQLERAALARRADEQNAQVVAGDDRGIYGEYRPHEDFPPWPQINGRKGCRKLIRAAAAIAW